ncbi:transposase, partial [Enterococcus lemanii]|uniref:transposase n=1 Tax=Enterococcus lemanii TaxID=1159752 RepID=UPI001EF7B47D
ELHALDLEPIIPLKSVPKNDGEVDAFYAPTCLLEHSYKYDSYDRRYGAIKYVQPKSHCKTCPLQHEGLCQKVIKIKQMNDPRKYNHPARGTQSWVLKYNERSSVERVNAYLKENYQLNDTRFYKAQHAVVFYHLIQLTYNARTFANQRFAKKVTEKE